jgi:hypothetical protein
MLWRATLERPYYPQTTEERMAGPRHPPRVASFAGQVVIEGRSLAALRAPEQALAMEIPQHHSSAVARGCHSGITHTNAMRHSVGSFRTRTETAIGA